MVSNMVSYIYEEVGEASDSIFIRWLTVIGRQGVLGQVTDPGQVPLRLQWEEETVRESFKLL